MTKKSHVYTVTLSEEDIIKLEFLIDHYGGFLPTMPPTVIRHLIRKDYERIKNDKRLKNE